MMKLIVQDEDLVDKEDAGTLGRIAQFASGSDVFKIPAAKQLLVAIKRVVRFSFFSVYSFSERLVPALGERQKNDTAVLSSSTYA